MPSARLNVEALLRGLVLALILLAAAPPHAMMLPVGVGLVGLLGGFGFAVVRARRLNPNAGGPLFWLYAVLHQPSWLLLGLLAGLVAGFGMDAILGNVPNPWLFGGVVAGGLAFAFALQLLRRVPRPAVRQGIAFALAALATAGLLYALEHPELTGIPFNPLLVGVAALVAAVVCFLLSFIGQEPQTEGDCAITALLLGVGLWLLLPAAVRIAALLVPLLLYLGYVLYLHRQMEALKWTLRALSEQRLGRLSSALASYRQALAAAPGHPAAEAGLWQIHRDLNPSDLAQNPELVRMLDLDLCLNRARDLLLRQGKPTPTQLADARKLLSLVEQQQPARRHEANYWRTVAHTHAGDHEAAADLLRSLLVDANHAPAEAPYRDAILAQAWHLALLGHPELKRRVGEPLLSEGHRLDAIAAVEKALKKNPADDLALALKPSLYAALTEAEYEKEAGGDPLRAALHFDHAKCHELGKPLLEVGQQWRRGAELWRIAARGKPEKAPALLRYLAEVARQHGDPAAALRHLAAVQRVGLAVGPAALPPEAKADYFAAVRELAEAAYAAGDEAAALRQFQLYAASDQSGADTQRRLAELHEKRGDLIAAMTANARCLVYDANHPQHLERRDKHYYSLTPADLKQDAEKLKNVFDLDYCVEKARSLLDHPKAGPEQIDWALHLLQLVEASQPDHLSMLVLLGRARLLRGERPAAQVLFERAFTLGKATPPGGTALDDWFLGCRLLGDLHLEDGQPERAIACLAEYRRSPKSGAATTYKLGQAHERLGDRARAAKCYENAAFYGGAVGDEARRALERVQAPAASSP